MDAESSAHDRRERGDILKPTQLHKHYEQTTDPDSRVGGSKRFFQALAMNGLKKDGAGRTLHYWGVKINENPHKDDDVDKDEDSRALHAVRAGTTLKPCKLVSFFPKVFQIKK